MFIRSLLAALVLVSPGLSLAGAHAQAEAERTVLITGSNRGIGLEFVRQYAALGWKVIATCRDPAGAEELQQLAAENANIIIEPLDLLDHEGIDALAARYSDQPIDVLLNNAGLMRGPDRGQMVGTIDYDEFDRFYRINAMGPLKVSEAFYPNVKRSDMKIMAALTTGKGERGIPVPGFSLYKTSKAALDAIQKEIALRWKRQGVKVVTLLPGRVLTRGEPEGSQNSVPIEESIRGMIEVLEDFDIEQSGKTVQWDGQVLD
jgi:NAD(P)-dependent dehydrogenase (short-subunit alcohol dehydrogenase family)